MASVPTGSLFFISTAIAAARTVTVATNATNCVVTSAAHGYTTGDVVEFASAWGRINRRVWEITVLTVDTFTLVGCNTTNATFYPAGQGLGTVRKVTAFTEITQVMSPTSSGGEPKKVAYKYIGSDIEYNINDGFSATSYMIEMDADSIGTPGYTALRDLSDVQSDSVLKIVKRNGGRLYQPCTVALMENESFTDGQINKVKASFDGNNRLTRY